MLTNKYMGFLFDVPDDTGDGGADAGDAGNRDDSGAGDNPIADPMAYAEALKKRLAERDALLDKNKAELAELAQLREFRQKRLKDEGNFEALLKEEQARLAELNPKAEAYDALVEAMREQNKARIENLPSDQQAIVKVLAEKLSPPELQSWLSQAAGVLGKPKIPSADGGRGVEDFSSKIVTDEDRRAAEIAKSQGYDVSAEDIAKRRAGQ